MTIVNIIKRDYHTDHHIVHWTPNIRQKLLNPLCQRVPDFCGSLFQFWIDSESQLDLTKAGQKGATSEGGTNVRAEMPKL